MRQTSPKLALQGVTALTPAGWLDSATLLISDGKFIDIDQTPAPSGYQTLDATGLHLLPGIVDIHGDAFERMICPRPGVSLPLDMALVENDAAFIKQPPASPL
ncbi:MAG: hypothetical protein AAF289_14195 [Cyanobacteria bacterium P01_A01_bin.135]